MILPRSIPFLLCCLVGSIGLAQDDDEAEQKRVPAPASLQEFITEAIGLLEAEKYQQALERLISPADKQKFQQTKRWEEVQKGFDAEKGEQLLKALREVQRSRTLLSHQNTVATYDIPKSLRTANSQMSFHLIQDKWYILNNRPPKEPESGKE